MANVKNPRFSICDIYKIHFAIRDKGHTANRRIYLNSQHNFESLITGHINILVIGKFENYFQIYKHTSQR